MGNKSKKERFVVWINVKPYVRQYLVDNYGVTDKNYPDLVDIRHDSQLAALFTTRLVKKTYRREKELEAKEDYKHRTCRVPLLISYEQFNRHGWALTLTDEATLVRALEIRCKTILLTYINSLYYVGGNLAQCIQLFYKSFNFNEFIWPVDSIRKIWIRESHQSQKDIKSDFLQKIQEIVLANLSKIGTITNKGLEAYGNN